MEAGREAGLVLSAQRGERRAFLELIREYQRPLYGLCFALVRDPEVAAQLAQESALRAWRGIQHLPVGRPFFPWIVRIARNLAVTRERRRAGDATGRVPLTRPDGRAWDRPELSMAQVDFEQRALIAFSELPPDEQMMLALRLLERLDYTAMGAVFDCQVGTAMHRMAQVRERLGHLMRREPRGSRGGEAAA